MKRAKNTTLLEDIIWLAPETVQLYKTLNDKKGVLVVVAECRAWGKKYTSDPIEINPHKFTPEKSDLIKTYFAKLVNNLRQDELNERKKPLN